MKLLDFPYVQQAFHNIAMDNGYRTGDRLLGGSEVPTWWLQKFEIAEYTLIKLERLGKLCQLLPEAHKMEGYEDLEGNQDSVLYHFVLPLNDIQLYIADAAGLKPSEYAFTQEILAGFFDGDLRQHFYSRGGR